MNDRKLTMVDIDYLNKIKIDKNMLRNAVPDVIFKSHIDEYTDDLYNEIKKYIKATKQKLWSMIETPPTHDEFEIGLHDVMEKVTIRYKSKREYVLCEKLEYFYNDIKNNETYKEYIDILLQMISETKEGKKINNSTMMFSNLLHKKIYGEKNE